MDTPSPRADFSLRVDSRIAAHQASIVKVGNLRNVGVAEGLFRTFEPYFTTRRFGAGAGR